MSEETDANLEKAINNLVTAMGSLNTHNEAMLKQLKDNEEAIKDNGTGKEGRRGILAAAKAIPGVGRLVTMGSDQITSAIRETNKIQTEAIGRGLQLANYTQMLADSTTSMTAGLTGYGDQLGAMVAQFDGGMRQNVEATRKLAIFTQATGGSSKKMMKDMRALTKGTGLSVEKEEHLSNTIIGLARTFNMTGDEIVSTMKGLSQNMMMLKSIGIAPEIQEATAALGAMMGPGMGGAAADFANQLLSVQGEATAAALGIVEERRKLLSGEGDATELLTQAMRKAGSSISSQMEGLDGDALVRQFSAFEGIFSKEMMNSVNMVKALDANAKIMNKNVGEMTQAAKNNTVASEIVAEDINSWGNLISVSFSPLVDAVVAVKEALFGFIQEFPKASVNIVRALGALGLIIAARGAKNLGGKLFGSGGGGAGKAAGGAAGGLGKGMGKGLIGLGRGLKAIGSPAAMRGAVTIGLLAASLGVAAYGFGQFASVDWQGIGKGTVALMALTAVSFVIGKIAGQLIPGAAAILILGASLVPFAFALNLMKGVGWGTFFMLGAGLLALTLATAAVGAIMMSGVGAVAILAGAGAFAILAAGLIPLAYAMNLAVPGLEQLGVVLATVATVPLANLVLLGPALIGMAAGFAALSAGGLIGSVLDGLGSLFGGDSPVEKLVKMGDAAEHINKLNGSLETLPELLDATLQKLGEISLDPFNKLAEGLAILKTSLDQFTVLDMAKFALFGGVLKGAPTSKASGGGGGKVVVAAPGLENKFDKFAGKFEFSGHVRRGEVTNARMIEGDPAQALHNERLDLARHQADKDRRERHGRHIGAEISQRFIEATEKNILILEEINDNLSGANQQRAAGVKVKPESRPMSMGSGRVGTGEF
jgi:hypothetical protein